MATIKLSGGKVILKSGKVSCSCCAGCCLYPFPGPSGTPIYPLTDLATPIYTPGDPGGTTPGFLDTVTPYDVSTTSGYDVTICYRHQDEPLTCVGFTHSSDELEQGWVWLTEYTTPEIFEWIGPCLIGSTLEDLFPNTLTVNGVDSITRDTALNLCLWSGGSWTLRYNATTYKFELNGVAKSGDQNSPLGTFGADVVS